MTSNTLPDILDELLEPLASTLLKLNRALLLAKRNKLPGPFIETISAAKDALDHSWESLQEIVTTLKPDYYTEEL